MTSNAQMSAHDDALPGFDRYASVTIQGGAVYGISLLGQLQGVLDAGYEVVALAGTSAGAIVATLYWAGLDTVEVRDFFVELAGPPSRVTELLGDDGPGPGELNASAVARRMLRLDWLSTMFAHPEPPHWYGRTLRRVARIGRGVFGSADIGYRSWANGGVFPGTNFERRIDQLIRSSQAVAPHVASGRLPAEGLLTFGHLWELLQSGDAFFPALTLTATNLCTRRLELFDSTDPRFFDVPIAKAVRASGGFPGFFRPVEITLPDITDPEIARVQCFVDGGVICNFPAYVFASRIRREQFGHSMQGIYLPYATRPWVNIGLRLIDTTPPDFDPAPFRTLPGVVGRMWRLLSEGTRTFLETELAEKTVERLISIPQPFNETGWPHDLLAFDKLTPELVHLMYTMGREAAAPLSRLNFEWPSADEIEPRMEELIGAALQVFGQIDNTRLNLRATLFVPTEFDLALRYRANMNDAADTDRDLRLEFWQGLVGFCFVRRRPVMCNLQQLGDDVRNGLIDADRSFGVGLELQGRIRKDRTWLLSVPVFDPATADTEPYGENPPLGVDGVHYAALDSPLDGALFGVLSLDGGFDYATLKLPPDAEEAANDPRVRALRDIMVAAAWEIGKTFDVYFAAPPADLDEE